MATVYDVIVNYKVNTSDKLAKSSLRADITMRRAQAKQISANAKLAGVEANKQIASQRKLNNEMKRATSRTSGGKGAGFMLADAFRWVGLAYLAHNTIGGIKSALIDFNTTLESTRIAMATGLFGFGQVKTFTEGLEKGKRLVEDYRKTAAAGVGELRDYTAMHSALQGSVFAAGGSLNQVTDMSKGGVVASSALGVEGWKAAQDIAQMVRGNVTERDFTAKQLIEMRFKDMGIETGGDALGKFREMYKADAKARLKFIQEALTSKTLKQAQAAYETSMQGRIDQFTDNIKLALAQVGEGLFEGVKDTLTDINKWISENPTKIRDIAKQIGDFAVSLFNGVKTLVSFIHEWSGLIIAGAKVWLAYALAAKAAGIGRSLLSAASAAAGGASAGGIGSMFVPGVTAAVVGVEIGKALGEHMEANGNTGYENTAAKFFSANEREANNYLRLKREERLALSSLNTAIDMTANKVGLLGSGKRQGAIEVERLNANDELVRKFESLPQTLMQAENIRVRNLNSMLPSWATKATPNTAAVSAAAEAERAKMAKDPLLAGKISDRERMQQYTGRIADFAASRGVDFMGGEIGSKESVAKKQISDAFGGMLSTELVDAAIAEQMTKAERGMVTFAETVNSWASKSFGADKQIIETKLDVATVAAAAIALLANTEAGKAALDAKNKKTPLKPGGMNVTINRIQVESNDPERFVYGMREAFADAVRNPSQAKPFIAKMSGGH